MSVVLNIAEILLAVIIAILLIRWIVSVCDAWRRAK